MRALGQALPPVLCLSPLITSPLVRHTRLHLYVIFNRRTSGRSLETLNKTSVVLNDGKNYTDKYPHVFYTAKLEIPIGLRPDPTAAEYKCAVSNKFTNYYRERA